MMGDAGRVVNFQFTNNLVTYGTYAIFGSGVTPGTGVLSAFSSNYLYGKDVFIKNTGAQSGIYPAGTVWATLSGAQFTEITGTLPTTPEISSF